MTQTENIKNWLLDGNTLTALQALEWFNCFRVGARAWDLRQQGFNVKSEMIELPSGKHCARYYIPKDDQLLNPNGHKKEKTPFDNETNSMIFYAFRYCLGRRSYVVGDCVAYLCKHWARIDARIQADIKRNITAAFAHDRYGSEIDRAEWAKVLDLE